MLTVSVARPEHRRGESRMIGGISQMHCLKTDGRTARVADSLLPRRVPFQSVS